MGLSVCLGLEAAAYSLGSQVSLGSRRAGIWWGCDFWVVDILCLGGSHGVFSLVRLRHSQGLGQNFEIATCWATCGR